MSRSVLMRAWLGGGRDGLDEDDAPAAPLP